MTLDLDNLSNDQLIHLNILSNEIKDDYHNLIYEIYTKSNKELPWLVNSLLSRNPYLSDLFINLLNLVFIIGELEKNNYDKIILNDNTLYEFIKKYFNNNVIIKHKNLRIKQFFKKIFSLSKLFYISILFTFDKIINIGENQINEKELRLIDVFWDKKMFLNNNYSDRYYGKLREYFDVKELNKIYYLPHIVNIKSLSFFRINSKKRNLNVIFKQDYIKIKDYFTIIYSLFKLKFNKNEDYYFRGINVSKLLYHDFHENKFNTSSFHGLLNYFFSKRLSESNPSNFKTLLNWFENQVIDRGLNKGFNDFFPNINLKGYQGFVVSLDYNSYLCPTKLENEIGVLPKEIFICSRALQNEVKRYNKELKVNIAPALRFEHLWKTKNVKISIKKIKVLVILPFTYNESIQIVRKIIDLAKCSKLKNINFKLKLHPDLNKNKLITFLGDISKNIKFEKKGLNEAFKKTHLLIGNTSSALTEGLAYGIPVIIIGNQKGLTQNPIPNNIEKTFWKLVYGKNQLLNAVIEFIDTKKQLQIKDNRYKSLIRLNYFEPMNKIKIRSLLDF